jgi:hypothetical protein
MDSLGAEAAGAEEAIAAAYPLLALCRRRLGALVGARSDRRACASRRADGPRNPACSGSIHPRQDCPARRRYRKENPMSRFRSTSALALAAVALLAWTRVGRHSVRRHRVASACLPDRALLDQPELHHEDLETYQDLLDESLNLTFPASDPICAQAATRCGDRKATTANAADWQLHPGSRADASTPGPR